MAEDTKREELEEYRKYLERLAESKSADMFSNGGIEHAAILMSVLLKNTKKIARVFSNGFKAELITEEPYWDALQDYLDDDNHQLLVLVETSKYMHERPLQTLRKYIAKRTANGDDKSIIVRELSNKGRRAITDQFGFGHCNFAIFDEDKFRYEYDPGSFKAFGSFNQPKNSRLLIDVFDRSFNDSELLSII